MASTPTEQLTVALQYEPRKDIIGGSFAQARKYVRSIMAATSRFEMLIEEVFGPTRKPTKTEIALLQSTNHHRSMFREISIVDSNPKRGSLGNSLRSYQDWKKVSFTLRDVFNRCGSYGEIRRKWSRGWHGKREISTRGLLENSAKPDTFWALHQGDDWKGWGDQGERSPQYVPR